MKKILFAAGVLLISTATFAHNTPNSDNKKGKKAARKEQAAQVNDFVKTQFYEDFPDATNINFERTKYYDEASFTSGTHQMRAYYDIRNELVGTTEVRPYSDLPANAQREIQKKYGNYKVEEVINYDDNELNDTDMTMFDTAFEGADNNFVVLRKNSEILIVKVDMAGNVSYFKALK